MKRLNIDMDFFFFFLAFYTAKKPSGEKELKITICWFQSEDNKGGGRGGAQRLLLYQKRGVNAAPEIKREGGKGIKSTNNFRKVAFPGNKPLERFLPPGCCLEAPPSPRPLTSWTAAISSGWTCLSPRALRLSLRGPASWRPGWLAFWRGEEVGGQLFPSWL